MVHTEHLVAYYEEKSQDLSTVLNIFIRLNSGGTPLSYSDLLLSIAVAQWKQRDARDEVHSLVDTLNKQGGQFAFSQDLVLKAGLVLTDIGSIGFKVENFNRENMARLEKQWPDVQRALILSVRLLATFGFNGQNLRANSALLPIAYYLRKLDPGEGYLTTKKYAEDRNKIQRWLTKSILKTSGIWGSGLDTLLMLLRETIGQHGKTAFPDVELEAAMSRRGKSLSFEGEELEELLDLQYNDSRTFALLSLLFPSVDLQNHFHVDHVFPASGFGKKKLRACGLEEKGIEEYRERKNGLPNLQLLEGHVNMEKQDLVPGNWLELMYSTEVERSSYRQRHLLPDQMSSWSDFGEFYEDRRSMLRQRLAQILGVEVAVGPVEEA